MKRPSNTADSARRDTRRRVLGVTAAILGFALVYGGAVFAYGLSTTPSGSTDCRTNAEPDAVVLSIAPTAVDAASNRIQATVEVQSLGSLAVDDDLGLLKEPLTISITDADGYGSTTIGAGEILSTQSVKFITDGSVEQWPFDVHHTEPRVTAFQRVDGKALGTALHVCVGAQIPGWSIATTAADNASSTTAEVDVPLTATRSAATVVFGFVLLALLAALPVLSLTVALAGLRGTRKVEATLTSWMAAMLFAVIPLRSFLPGSPPIGSWIDYLLVLWVVAGLVVALTVYVIAFMRWAPNGPDAPIIRRRDAPSTASGVPAGPPRGGSASEPTGGPAAS